MSSTRQPRLIRTSSPRILAWTLRRAGAVSGALTFGFTVALGLYADHALLYLTLVAAGLWGALVAAHESRKSVGWLMCIASLAAVLLYLRLSYGYVAVVAHHDYWPLSGAAVRLAVWVWVPVTGLFLPMLTVRFLDGRVPRRWPPIDRLATARKIAVALSTPIAPRGQLVAYLPPAPKLLAQVPPALALVAHLGFQPLSGSQGARRLQAWRST